jgi:hypothetical protein
MPFGLCNVPYVFEFAARFYLFVETPSRFFSRDV